MSGLVPFKTGYDARRNGNGRKPSHRQLWQMIEDNAEATLFESSISQDDLVQSLVKEARRGNVRALSVIFRVCGLYNNE